MKRTKDLLIDLVLLQNLLKNQVLKIGTEFTANLTNLLSVSKIISKKCLKKCVFLKAPRV